MNIPALRKKRFGRNIFPQIFCGNPNKTFLINRFYNDSNKIYEDLIYPALKPAEVLPEMHVFTTDGHAYGLRGLDTVPKLWPKLTEKWLRGLGILKGESTLMTPWQKGRIELSNRNVIFFILVFPLFLSGLVFADKPVSVTGLLQPFVDKHELAGAVALAADKDKVLSVEAVGFADIAGKKSMKPDAIFWIASQSKAMTASAVMMLVDEGKIGLDDPVEKYLPEFRGQMVVVEKDDDHTLLRKPSHPITVREVLSHMSGLPFQSAMEVPTLDGLPLSAVVRSYAMTTLQTEPGTHYAYSNAGINTAARILEVVSGMKYEDFMQQRLFEPLGMIDTTFWPTEKQIPRIAKSYRPDDTKTNLVEIPIGQLIYPLTDRVHRFPMPAGGLFSTAQDTARFCQMLLNGGKLNGRQFLSDSAFHELIRRQTPASVKENYGFGLALGSDWFGHGGAFATNMEIRPNKDLVMIWMVQHDGFPGDGGNAQNVFKQWALEHFGK